MNNVSKHSGDHLGFSSADEARDRFMSRLHTMEPDCFAGLCSSKGLKLAAVAQDRLVRAMHGQELGSVHWEAEQAKHEHIKQWQRRWHLVAVPAHVSRQDQKVSEWRHLSQRERERQEGSSSDISWITDIADATLRYYVVNEKYGEPVPMSFVASTRFDTPLWETQATLSGRPVTVDLKARNLTRGLETVEGLSLLTWNRRAEPRRAARDRLMMLIDSALDRIDREALSISIMDEHFDWLIRFQVKGQNQTDIAVDVGRNRGHVNREINKTAELIGLEPRNGKAGRRPRETGRSVIAKS